MRKRKQIEWRASKLHYRIFGVSMPFLRQWWSLLLCKITRLDLFINYLLCTSFLYNRSFECSLVFFHMFASTHTHAHVCQHTHAPTQRRVKSILVSFVYCTITKWAYPIVRNGIKLKKFPVNYSIRPTIFSVKVLRCNEPTQTAGKSNGWQRIKHFARLEATVEFFKWPKRLKFASMHFDCLQMNGWRSLSDKTRTRSTR